MTQDDDDSEFAWPASDSDGSTADDSTADDSTADDSAADGSPADGSPADGSAAEEGAVGDSAADDAVDESTADESTADEGGTDEGGTDDAVAGEAATAGDTSSSGEDTQNGAASSAASQATQPLSTHHVPRPGQSRGADRSEQPDTPQWPGEAQASSGPTHPSPPSPQERFSQPAKPTQASQSTQASQPTQLVRPVQPTQPTQPTQSVQTGRQEPRDPAEPTLPAVAPPQPEPAVVPPAQQAEPPTQQEETPDRPGGKRRLRWILTGSAVLLVVALAVVLALPVVSNRLALPWAPNAPKADPPEPVAIQRSLDPPRTGSAHRPTASGVSSLLGGMLDDPALGKLTGSVRDPASGRTLWSSGPREPRTPASTTKLLTSAAALLSMGPDTRIPTKVVSGDRPGTVVLVAGGDVTLSSLPKGKESVYPDAAHLDQLVAEVNKATGGDVERVALDMSAYSGDTTAAGWEQVDTEKYTAKTVPAMLDGGRKKPRSNHSDRVQDPAGKLLNEFADRLGADVASDSTVTAPRNTRTLGKVRSAPLTTLVRRCLTLSDNVLADALARQVAMHTGNEPSFEGATKAIRQVLAGHGFNVDGLRLADGSGLSDHNKVPAGLLADVLAVAADPTPEPGSGTGALRPMLTGLPVAGGTGTLADRYAEGDARQGRGWVRAKTGTLTEVSTLAGTVLDSDGRVLVFVFMSSGTSISEARPALDELAAKLRSCGCSGG